MYENIKKFFGFCDQKNRNKLYRAVLFGVLDAILGAMKIPAAFVAFGAVINHRSSRRRGPSTAAIPRPRAYRRHGRNTRLPHRA